MGLRRLGEGKRKGAPRGTGSLAYLGLVQLRVILEYGNEPYMNHECQAPRSGGQHALTSVDTACAYFCCFVGRFRSAARSAALGAVKEVPLLR